MPCPSENRPEPAQAGPTDEGMPHGAGTRPEQQPSLPDPGPLGDIATDLLLAVCEDDEAGVRRVLDRCPDLLHLQTSELGLAGKDNTPLHVAASCGHIAVARVLVGRGACALGRDVDGDTPFNRAVLGMHWEVAEYLASVGGAGAETERDQSCLAAYERHTREASGAAQAGGRVGLAHWRDWGNWGRFAKQVERLAQASAARLRAEFSFGYRGIRRPALTAAVALLVLVSAGGLVARRALERGFVSMPKLTGLSESTATGSAPEEIRLQVAGEEHAAEPRGTVLRQEPAPGERVAKGGTARIWVSLGPASPAPSVVGPFASPQTARIPEVVDLPVTSAREALAEAGLACTVAGYEYDRSHPEGTVIRQDPPAGPVPGALTDVRVVVSRGWRVRVPSVAGLTQSAATERLRQSGLVVAVASRRDGSIARGLAVGSTPPAGRTVERGSRVTLIISTGKPRAPALGYGTLSVSAEPQGCEVWVYVDGGDPRGTCPLTIRLAPGDHTVTLWDTSHELGIQQDLRVEIADGASTKLHQRIH